MRMATQATGEANELEKISAEMSYCDRGLLLVVASWAGGGAL